MTPLANLAGLAALALVAASASAQSKPDPLGFEAVHNFGRCAADRSPAAARDLLAMDFRTEEYRQALRRFVRGHDYCGAGNYVLRAGSLLFAGAMAEALIEQERAADLAARLAAKPKQPLTARSDLELTAVCTAHRAPTEVAALFRTAVNSPDEAAAVSSLARPLGECLAGAPELRANRPAIRALLALAALRLVQEGAR
jgi:hypothetical protein